MSFTPISIFTDCGDGYGVALVRDGNNNSPVRVQVDLNPGDGTAAPRIILGDGKSVNVDESFVSAYRTMKSHEALSKDDRKRECSAMAKAAPSVAAAPDIQYANAPQGASLFLAGGFQTATSRVLGQQRLDAGLGAAVYTGVEWLKSFGNYNIFVRGGGMGRVSFTGAYALYPKGTIKGPGSLIVPPPETPIGGGRLGGANFETVGEVGIGFRVWGAAVSVLKSAELGESALWQRLEPGLIRAEPRRRHLTETFRRRT